MIRKYEDFARNALFLLRLPYMGNPGGTIEPLFWICRDPYHCFPNKRPPTVLFFNRGLDAAPLEQKGNNALPSLEIDPSSYPFA